MKKVVCLVLLAGLVLSFNSCRQDVFVAPPRTLEGEYEGIYIYEVNEVQKTQPITWRFTDEQYYSMSFLENDNGEVREFCDNSGDYILNNISSVELISTDANFTQIVCTPSFNPVGQFAVQNANETNDTLTLFQEIDDQTITIKLVFIE